MATRLPSETVATFLSQTALLRTCELDDLFDLAQAADQRSFRQGEMLLSPGKTVEGLGLLLSGRVALVLVDAVSGTRTTIESLSPGDLFGEVGLLLDSGNPLAVVAEENCLALVVGKQLLDQVLARSPTVSLALAKRVSSRFVQVCVLGTGSSPGQGSQTLAPPPQTPTPRPAPTPDPPPRSKPGEIPWVDVGSFQLSPEVLAMVPAQLIQKHRLLPLRLRGKHLLVGMVNPKSVGALQELKRVLHTVDPEVVAISGDDFNGAFVRLKLDTGHARPRAAGRHAPITYQVDQDREAEKSQLIIGNEVIGMFDRILQEALEMGASDIHIEPDATGLKVRYRVSGNLVQRQEFISASYAAPVLARIKVLAQLDITERRLPQDGRIEAQWGRQELNLRISTMNVARGEKAVIRVIDPANVMRPLHQIFGQADQEQAVRQALAEPYGAIIVAGPTGSGKSSTLYSMLNDRRQSRPDTNIVTVEDPVEFLLQGVTQVPVRPRVGFDFATALRALVRQDPDVIMIGELRDQETTTSMIEAALTGHLVLTSIHGNNVSAVIQRIQHLGADQVLLSQALSMIVVQRLAKRLCPNCAADREVAPALLESLSSRRIIKRGSVKKLPSPLGCEACHKTGYIGRIAVQETLRIDDDVRTILAEGVPPSELIERAEALGRFTSFARAAAHLMARRILAPSDALLVVSE